MGDFDFLRYDSGVSTVSYKEKPELFFVFSTHYIIYIFNNIHICLLG